MVSFKTSKTKKEPDGTTTTTETSGFICTIFKKIPLKNIEREITLNIR